MSYGVDDLTCKEGTNLEFHSNRISSEFRIRIESNTNIQWLQIQLEYWTVSRFLAGTRRHPVATSTGPGRSRRHRGHTHRSCCLLSDLTMETTSYSRQTYPHIPNIHIHTLLGYKRIFFIPVKNKIKKTNSRKTRRHQRGLLGARRSS